MFQVLLHSSSSSPLPCEEKTVHHKLCQFPSQDGRRFFPYATGFRRRRIQCGGFKGFYQFRQALPVWPFICRGRYHGPSEQWYLSLLTISWIFSFLFFGSFLFFSLFSCSCVFLKKIIGTAFGLWLIEHAWFEFVFLICSDYEGIYLE